MFRSKTGLNDDKQIRTLMKRSILYKAFSILVCATYLLTPVGCNEVDPVVDPIDTIKT